MPTPVQAMLWELWRLSRWELLYRTLGISLLWGCVFWIFRPEANMLPILAFAVFMVTVMTSLFSELWMGNFDNVWTGFSFYLGFPRPISTAKLVAIPMVYISCTAAVCYLIPAGFLRAMFGVPLPLLPVAAMIAAVCSVFVMAIWSAQSQLARSASLVALMLLTAAFVVFGVMGGPLTLSDEALMAPDTLLKKFSLSFPEYLALLALFVGSIAVTTLAVGRQRHGERLTIGWRGVDRTDLSYRLLKWDRPFSTRRQAQYWYEMRRSGAPILLLGLCAAVFVFLLTAAMMATEGQVKLATCIWAVSLLIFYPGASLLMGAEWLLGLRHKQGAVSLPLFDATQAMDNGGLMVIKLTVLASCVFLSWWFMATAAAAWTLLWGDYHLWLKPASAIQPFLSTVSLPYWGCIGLVLLVGCVTLAAMLMSGALFAMLYPKVAFTVVAAGFIYFLLALWDAKHGWKLRIFWEAHSWGMTPGYCVATILLWRKVLRDGYLQRGHLLTSLCLWFVYLCAAVTLYLHVVPGNVVVPLSALVLGFSSLTLPLIATAAAPLTLAAHRHR